VAFDNFVWGTQSRLFTLYTCVKYLDYNEH
jgi:hypothetical protein